MKLTCPCCGFRTIDDDCYGSYNICQVCGWEDDQVQLSNPCSGGGANKQSLYEEQLKFASTRSDGKGFKRDKEWRPLTADEITYFQSITKEKHWSFKGIVDPREVYWIKGALPCME